MRTVSYTHLTLPTSDLVKKRRGKCHIGAANAAQRELWKRHWHDIPRRPEEKEELPQ